MSTQRLVLTTDISLPAARRKALVHFDFRGFLFRVKFLWHLDRQNRNTFFRRSGFSRSRRC